MVFGEGSLKLSFVLSKLKRVSTKLVFLVSNILFHMVSGLLKNGFPKISCKRNLKEFGLLGGNVYETKYSKFKMFVNFVL